MLLIVKSLSECEVRIGIFPSRQRYATEQGSQIGDSLPPKSHLPRSVRLYSALKGEDTICSRRPGIYCPRATRSLQCSGLPSAVITVSRSVLTRPAETLRSAEIRLMPSVHHPHRSLDSRVGGRPPPATELLSRPADA